ncbi:Gfo/Idh/MocA family oxidoreductase [Shewanella avicenniae]|uniref:Gfo/Idh/MocA family oxidoreductase n=1 Tax=Shewanella avicenniae TaxID=2814294 RepID=A0ABX7QTQ9_9GAMM|nr:Gfo/Idh/MocA family oxidoreductase [Shewanella avicenniae]QSX34654.1 Gfo/Idh/MocA family oxidoreductase [Shewanella avicenniae]
MSQQPIRVGFIGLNPDSHWAATAHLPALKSLGDTFEVVAVANSTPESGKRTAEALNLPYAFDTPQALATSDVVDLVVVTVKVPYHYELATAALEAGKHVHCEWPLGNGVAEAQKLTELAAAKGVVATVGTQMRTAPEITYLKQLIADGYVGKVLSSSLIGSGGNWGAESSAELAYLFDKTNGATMLTIPFGHTLAGVQDVLGEFADISGRTLKVRETVRITDTGEDKQTSTADQILVHGQLQSGAAFSAHYRGGMSRATNFLWEINGTDGDIQITGNIGHGQFAQMTIKGASGSDTELQTLVPPAELLADLPEGTIARNVAGIYRLIAKDIQTGSREAPSFADALKLHQLLDAISQGNEYL